MRTTKRDLEAKISRLEKQLERFEYALCKVAGWYALPLPKELADALMYGDDSSYDIRGRISDQADGYDNDYSQYAVVEGDNANQFYLAKFTLDNVNGINVEQVWSAVKIEGFEGRLSWNGTDRPIGQAKTASGVSLPDNLVGCKVTYDGLRMFSDERLVVSHDTDDETFRVEGDDYEYECHWIATLDANGQDEYLWDLEIDETAKAEEMAAEFKPASKTGDFTQFQVVALIKAIEGEIARRCPEATVGEGPGLYVKAEVGCHGKTIHFKCGSTGKLLINDSYNSGRSERATRKNVMAKIDEIVEYLEVVK